MSEIASAAARALSHGSPYVLVSGRTWAGLEVLAEGAQAHLIVPATRARLAVSEGIGLGGRRSIVALDDAPEAPAPPLLRSVTASVACARLALGAGWSVAVPSRPQDVEHVVEQASLLLVDDAVAVTDEAGRVPALNGHRIWSEGPLATLVASGPAVVPMRRLAQRLAARGVGVSAVELPVLGRVEQAPLVGGEVLGVGGGTVLDALQKGEWDDSVSFVEVVEVDEADLVGAVLARVPAAGTA